MKKTIAILAAALLALSLIPAVYADSGLPFKLNAPSNISVTKTDGDSPTTMQFTYSVPNDMCAFLKSRDNAEDPEAFFADYPFDDLWVNIQIDWAVDDVLDPVSGWHYTQYWDGLDRFGFGYDEEGRIRVSDWDCASGYTVPSDSVGDVWLLRGIPNDSRWNGDPEQGTPGVKDQLDPEQYTYDYENEELYIDFTEHTVYLRARFAVTTRVVGDDVHDYFHYSEWSDAVCYGKEAGNNELDLSVIKAPAISGLRILEEDYNGYPVVAYTLTVPDDLAALLPSLQTSGGLVMVEAEARVKGGEWVTLDGDWTVTAGEMHAFLQRLYETSEVGDNSELEFRTRYYVSVGNGEEFWTEYSNAISFGADGATVPIDPAPGATSVCVGTEDPGQAKTGCAGCVSLVWALVPIAALAVGKAAAHALKR